MLLSIILKLSILYSTDVPICCILSSCVLYSIVTYTSPGASELTPFVEWVPVTCVWTNCMQVDSSSCIQFQLVWTVDCWHGKYYGRKSLSNQSWKYVFDAWRIYIITWYTDRCQAIFFRKVWCVDHKYDLVTVSNSPLLVALPLGFCFHII